MLELGSLASLCEVGKERRAERRSHSGCKLIKLRFNLLESFSTPKKTGRYVYKMFVCSDNEILIHLAPRRATHGDVRFLVDLWES